MNDALALLELDSVAGGLSALNVLVKRAPVEVFEANLVEPGKFLIMFSGGVAEVEESHAVVLERFGEQLLSEMYLPMVHPALVDGLRGVENREAPDTLGVVEGSDVASTLKAADRALKDASVVLCGLRVAVALGGRAYFVVAGEQHDVEASVASAKNVLDEQERLHRVEVILRPHEEMVAWLLRPAPFRVG
jgi:microcompartment protein CcmL/EutN